MTGNCNNKKALLVGILSILLAIAIINLYGYEKESKYAILDNSQIGSKYEVFYFYNNPCTSCNEGEKFSDRVAELLRTNHVGFSCMVNYYYVYGTEGNRILEKQLRTAGLLRSDVNFPIVVAGNESLEGYDMSDTELMSCIEKGYSDWISATYRHNSSSYNDENTDTNYDSKIELAINDHVIIRYFKTENCAECRKAQRIIDETTEHIDIKEYSVVDGDNANQLNKLFAAYSVPDVEQKVPIVFIGEKYLSGSNITRKNVLELIGDTNANKMYVADGSDDALSIDNSISVMTVTGTGFVNGLNACTLSMTLLFLSLLALGKVKFLINGICFVCGRFVCYIIAGILVTGAVSGISFESLASTSLVLNIIMLLFCAIFIVGNIYDFIQLLRGKLGSVKMQLPASLRKCEEKILKKIIKLQRSALFPVFVFVGGFLVSAGEFFCTGQIYLASIIHWIQVTPESTVPVMWFVLYSAALCTPALIIVILISKGKSIFHIQGEALVSEPWIKLLNAIIFTILALYTLFALF